jgi:hypothetical protein
MLLIGPHFVASAVRYIPSTLREKQIQGRLKTEGIFPHFNFELPHIKKLNKVSHD